MKSQLKRGRRVEIFRYTPPLSQTDQPLFGARTKELEGTAILQSLIRKYHDEKEPSEIWMVKFDEDDEPVQREILVEVQPKPSGMLSSMARSSEGKNLLLFMKTVGLSHDWSDPTGHGVTAFVNGQTLDNTVGASELTATGQVNCEILVHLEHKNIKIVVNLNTMLALASGYVRQQYGVAEEAIKGLVVADPPYGSVYLDKRTGSSNTAYQS